MVPAGEPTYQTVEALAGLLAPGDVIVDGGNSRYTDDIRHAEALAERGIGFVDCGVSGGVWGLTEGYALMVGGERRARRPAQADLRRAQARGRRPASSTPGRSVPATSPRWCTTASSTALMQAYAEGWELLDGHRRRHRRPRGLPVLAAGTVIRSWLLDLLVRALDADEHLEQLQRLRRRTPARGAGR